MTRYKIACTVLAALAQSEMTLPHLQATTRLEERDLERALLSLLTEGIVEYQREPERCYRLADVEADLSFLDPPPRRQVGLRLVSKAS